MPFPQPSFIIPVQNGLKFHFKNEAEIKIFLALLTPLLSTEANLSLSSEETNNPDEHFYTTILLSPQIDTVFGMGAYASMVNVYKISQSIYEDEDAQVKLINDMKILNPELLPSALVLKKNSQSSPLFLSLIRASFISAPLSSEYEKHILDLVISLPDTLCNTLVSDESFQLHNLSSQADLFEIFIHKLSIEALERNIVSNGKVHARSWKLSPECFVTVLNKLGKMNLQEKIFGYLNSTATPHLAVRTTEECFFHGLFGLTSHINGLKLIRQTYENISVPISNSPNTRENTNYSLADEFIPIFNSINISPTKIEFGFRDKNRKNIFKSYLSTKFNIENNLSVSDYAAELTLSQFVTWLGYEALRDVLDVSIFLTTKNIEALKAKILSLNPFLFNLMMLLDTDFKTPLLLIYESYSTDKDRHDFLSKFYDETFMALNEECLLGNGRAPFSDEVFQERMRLARINLISSLSQVYSNPEIISSDRSSLCKIELYDHGESSDTWSPITKTLLQQAPSMVRGRYNIFESKQIPDSLELNTLDLQSIEIEHQLEFSRLLGRTLLFSSADGLIVAVKIQKRREDENVAELIKEFYTTKELRENADLNMQSQLPLPLYVANINNVVSYIQSKVNAEDFSMFTNLVGNAESHAAYIYKASADYFIYLNDASLSEAQYQRANRDAVHDLFSLLSKGIVYTQLASLFHAQNQNRSDAGRYLVLANLLQPLSGTGRLRQWHQAIGFPNIRASGIADLGDWMSLDNFIGETAYVAKYFSDTWRINFADTPNYLIANIMAEYQYILFLIAGKRSYDLTLIAKRDQESPNTIKNIWLNAAKQIIQNVIQAITIFSTRRESEIISFMNSIIDAERLARQMQYWMTEEYVPDVMQNKIPQDIYGSNVAVDVAFEKNRENCFSEKCGFSTNGTDPDLGVVNGQEPIKEANKLFYWMVNMIFTEFFQLKLVVKDFKKIKALSHSDIELARQARKESFKYLPDKQRYSCEFFANQLIANKTPESTLAETPSNARHTEYVTFNLWKNKSNKRKIDSQHDPIKRSKLG